jgi:hypothetical protein
MVSAELCRTVSAPLIEVTLSGKGGGDRQEEDVFAKVLEQAPGTVPETLLSRFGEECRFFDATGYAPAIAELIRLGQEIHRLGATLHVEGAAAGSTVFHLASLTPFDPAEHGLLSERFIDTGRSADAGWPWSDRAVAEPDYFAARTSLSPQEFLLVLRRRGYLFAARPETIPGLSCTITAKPRGVDNDTYSAHVVVTASSVALLSNCLSAHERAASQSDPQTWHLLAAGDTAGIEVLESEVVREALRLRKPKSLEQLTDVLAITRMGSASDAFGVRDVPVYQEDLMQVLHAALGIGLRDAYELVRTLGNPLSPTVVRAREAFFSVQPPEPFSPREWNRLWDRLVDECPHAVCKANYLATAHHGLQAAYLKAHHPAEFRAVLRLVSA